MKIECDCGNRSDPWNTFCFKCGKWIETVPSTGESVSLFCSKFANCHFNFENTGHWHIPAPGSSGPQQMAVLFELLLILDKTRFILFDPSISEAVCEHTLTAAKPELAGFLRPFLLIPRETGLDTFHLGRTDAAPKHHDSIGSLTTSPAIYDRKPLKRAFFGHRGGILLFDCSPDTLNSNGAAKSTLLELNLEPDELFRNPILIDNHIIFLTSRARVVRLPAEASESQLKKTIQIEGNAWPEPDKFCAGAPVIFSNEVFFEMISYGANDSVTITLMHLEFNASKISLETAISFTDEGIPNDVMIKTEEREKHTPIVAGSENLLISSPNMEKIYLISHQNAEGQSPFFK